MIDWQAYLANNPDVAAAGVDPSQHYAQYGQAEGRQVTEVPAVAQQGPWWDITTPAAVAQQGPWWDSYTEGPAAPAGPTPEQQADSRRAALAAFDAQVAAHPERLGADGRFLGPGAGVNYMLEGWTPDDVRAVYNRPDGPQIDGGGDASYRDASDAALLNTDWRTGPNNGGGFLGGIGRMGQGIFDGIRTNPAIMAALTAGVAPYANQGLQAAGFSANTAKALTPLVVNAGSTIVKGGNAADALRSAGMAYIGGEAAKSDVLGNLPQVAKDGIKSLISSGMDPKKAITAFAMSQLPKGAASPASGEYTPRTNWPEDVTVSPEYLASKRAAVDAESAYRDFDAPEIGQFNLPPVDLGAEARGEPPGDIELEQRTITGKRLPQDEPERDVLDTRGEVELDRRTITGKRTPDAYTPFDAPELDRVVLSPVDLGLVAPAPKAAMPPSTAVSKIIGMIPKGTGTAPSAGGTGNTGTGAQSAAAAYGYPQLANIRVQDFSSKKQRLNAKGQLLEDDDNNKLTPDVTVADRDETKENAPMLSALGLPPADTMAALFEIT